MGCADNIFRLYAGEITTKRITVIQPKDKVTDPDVPTDLTGTEVVITCKESTSQSNAEAVAQVSQSVHVDAINGITDLVFDLTNVSNRIKNEGCLLTCDAWIINDSGERLPQGVFEGEVIASPNKADGVVAPDDPTISVEDDTLTVNGDIDTQGSIVLTGTLTAAGDISTSGDLDVVNVNASGTVTAGGDISSGGSITATGDISGDDFNASGSITSGGDITATGDIQANSITVSGDGNVGGKISTDGCVEAGCLALDDQTSNPTLSGTGKSAIWQSDGTGSGDDGDLMVSIFDSLGGSITRTLVDFDSNRSLTDGQLSLLSHLSYDDVNEIIVADRAIETTLNSLFLGEQHKMTSGAENIFFKNLGSDISYFPMWAGLKDQSIVENQDSTGYISPSARTYSDMVSTALGGNPAEGTSADYSDTTTFAVSAAGLGVSTVIAEDIDVDTELEYTVSIEGRAVYSQQISFNTLQASGSTIEWFFDHPVEVHAGTTVFAEIRKRDKATKSDLGVLKVRQGDDGTGRYYSVVHNRLFEDKDLELISPYSKYQSMDFGVDTTGSSIFLRDLSLGSDSALVAHGINTIEAVANGSTIQVKLKDGKKILVESLPVSGASIDGVSVNSVLNQAIVQLNDLFTNGLSFSSQGNPVTDFSLNGSNLTLILQDSTSYTVDVTTLGVDENKFVQSASLVGTDLQLTMNDAQVLTASLSDLDDIDTNTVVSSGVVSGTDIVLTLSDNSTVVIDASTFEASGGNGGATSVVSGEVVGQNLVLTMDDATTVTINAQNMVNGSQLPARSAGWYIAYGNDSGDAVTSAGVISTIASKQPFYAAETLSRREEFIWNHDTNGPYALGIWSGAESAHNDSDVFADSNWEFNFKFLTGGNIKVSESSHNVTVGTLFSSGYTISDTTVLALTFEADGHIALYNITGGGRILIGRTTIAQTGNSVNIFMGGGNQPNAIFPVMTKRLEKWTMVHDELGTQNGVWTNGVDDHTVLKANHGISVGQKYVIDLSGFGRSHSFGFDYTLASTGVSNAEDSLNNTWYYRFTESIRANDNGLGTITLNENATYYTGSQSTGWYANGPAGVISLRYITSGVVEIWSETYGEKIADFDNDITDPVLYLHFGAEEEVTSENLFLLGNYSIQDINQGSQPVVTFRPTVDDQSFDVTESDSLNAQLVASDYIVNQWVEVDAPSWVYLNQNTGLLTGTAPAYTGTSADQIVINCKAANAAGGTTNFQVTLNIQEITYTNTKSLLFEDGDQSYLGANAALLAATLGRNSNGSGSGDEWSFSMWYKGSTHNSGQTIFYFGDNDTVNGGNIELRQTNHNGLKRLRLRYGSGGNHLQLTTPSGSITPSTWQHILVTYDGGTTGASSGDVSSYYSRFKIYIDGALQSTSNTHSNYGYSGGIDADNYRIGRYSSGNYMREALVNQFAVWDSDQSSNISDIYNGGSTQDLSLLSDGPAHYYEIEDSVTTIQDLIGNAHFVGYNLSSSDLVTDTP